MEQYVSTYEGGMDKESSPTKFQNDRYLHAEELRFLAHEEGRSGSFSNHEGNTLSFNLPSDTGYIHGHGFLRSKLVLFTRKSGADRIYYIDLTQSLSNLNNFLKFEGDLNFDSSYPITKAVGNYETHNVEKIYWTDNYNSVRHANLSEDLSGYTTDRFEFIPDINFVPVGITSIGSGNLKSGVVQYAYQLYNLRGSESGFSPASSIVSLTPSALTGSDSRAAEGGDIGTNSGKSVSIDISISVNEINRFDRIRILRIHHEDRFLLPIIDVISEQHLTSDVHFTDMGGFSLETIPVEFFREITAMIKAEDISVKNNYMFYGGITEEYFDMSFYDARAYRFTGTGGGPYVPIDNMATVGSDTIMFDRTILFPETASAGIPVNPELKDLWYHQDGIIYFLAPLDGAAISGNTMVALSNATVTSNNTVEAVISYSEGRITFNRNVHSRDSIIKTEETIDMPPMHIWDPDGGGGELPMAHLQSDSGDPTISLTPGAWSVPSTHDAINPYNRLPEDTTNPNVLCKYQSDGTTMGGEGPNVRYEFKTKSILIDNSDSDYFFHAPVDGDSYTSYASPYISSQYVGYQRDEIYSFGIIGFDNKGRQSFVNWIGDIRMPKSTDMGFELITEVLGDIFANVLYLEFTVTNLPNDVVSYKIVRCERTRNDRTVLDSGIMGSVGNETAGIQDQFRGPFSNIKMGMSTINPEDNRLYEYITPETNFNKENVMLLTDSIEITEYGTITHNYISQFQDSQSYWQGFSISKVKSYTPSVLASEYRELSDIQLFTTSNNTESFVTIDGIRLKNQVRHETNTEDSNYKGTTLVLRTKDPVPDQDRNPTHIFKANRKRHVYPYNGSTHTARTIRTFIPCSEMYPVSHTDPIDVFGGDTFIEFFDYLRVIWNGERPATKRYGQAVYFPIETSINLSLRLDGNLNKIYNGIIDLSTQNPNQLYIAMKETAGIHLTKAVADPSTPVYFVQKRDLYQYNPVYSKPNNAKEYIARPFDFDQLSTNKFDSRVTVSDKKINGELADSWTKVRFNNFIDLDPSKGALTAIQNIGNHLWVFQPNGVGIVAVEERELTQSTNAGMLVLGTGGVLSRYDYIPEVVGCMDKRSIVVTNAGVFFYDRLRNTFNRLGENTEKTSKMLGMQPYFNKHVTNASSPVICGYNEKYNEVYVTYTDPSNGFTLSLDIGTNTFRDFKSFVPSCYIIAEDSLYSVQTPTSTSVFKHNAGAMSTYYGTTHPSKLTLVVNPAMKTMCRYDVIKFITDVLNHNGDTLQKTFNTLRAYNSYQDTGVIDLQSHSKFKRRMRTWRFNYLRDIHIKSPSLKDYYLIIELTFNNNGTDIIRIDDVMTLFQPLRIH